MGLWLRQDLAPLVEAHLQPQRMEALGLAARPIERLLAEHRRGFRDHSLKIWALLALDLWADQTLSR